MDKEEVIRNRVNMINKTGATILHSDSVELLGEIILRCVYPSIKVSINLDERPNNLSEGFFFNLEGEGKS